MILSHKQYWNILPIKIQERFESQTRMKFQVLPLFVHFSSNVEWTTFHHKRNILKTGNNIIEHIMMPQHPVMQQKQ